MWLRRRSQVWSRRGNFDVEHGVEVGVDGALCADLLRRRLPAETGLASPPGCRVSAPTADPGASRQPPTPTAAADRSRRRRAEPLAAAATPAR